MTVETYLQSEEAVAALREMLARCPGGHDSPEWDFYLSAPAEGLRAWWEVRPQPDVTRDNDLQTEFAGYCAAQMCRLSLFRALIDSSAHELHGQIEGGPKNGGRTVAGFVAHRDVHLHQEVG